MFTYVKLNPLYKRHRIDYIIIGVRGWGSITGGYGVNNWAHYITDQCKSTISTCQVLGLFASRITFRNLIKIHYTLQVSVLKGDTSDTYAFFSFLGITMSCLVMFLQHGSVHIISDNAFDDHLIFNI